VSCSQQEKATNCREYDKAIDEIGIRAAMNIPKISERPKGVSNKDYQIQYSNGMADNISKDAVTFKSLHIKGVVFKKIQSNIVKATEGHSQYWRNRAKAFESLSEGADRASIDAAMNALNSQPLGFHIKQSSELSQAVADYCKS
jgi:hypothetical protein